MEEKKSTSNNCCDQNYLISVVEKYQKDPTRLMDILIDVQKKFGSICGDCIKTIAKSLALSEVDVKQTMSFYHFFTCKSTGKYAIYLNDSVVACMMGRNEVAKAFEEAAGCKFNSVTSDGIIGLHDTACIGMNDQEPAAIINGVVFTKLNATKAKELITAFKAGKKVEDMVTSLGDGNNASQLVKSMVNNNLKKKGQVVFSEYIAGTAIKKLAGLTTDQVLALVKDSGIRGRGGAGFPTGMKWDFCKRAAGNEKIVICNADEGEPGTFKDRVILTEVPKLVFEGMATCGYVIGAKQGILYLRAEYSYLKAHLENALTELRKDNLLGKSIAGKSGFDFDIRIQMGAGAYVCGEESALIESAEGKRGEPRNRPPFPAQKGYLGLPTVINNVETLCSVVKIVEKGADWYKSIGTKESTGTKVLSISGDCKNPGVYEIEWGMTIKQMLEMVGAEKTQAVQVAGPSGVLISSAEFDRKIANEDLPTGGAMIVIGPNRDILKDVVLNFTHFFIDESCGSCVPCRALTIALKNTLEKIIAGKGTKTDLDNLEKWSKTMKPLNRCGLGQTASNPILTSIKNFRDKYEKLLVADSAIYKFDMDASVKESCSFVNRVPNYHE